jgi:hypothetical protein
MKDEWMRAERELGTGPETVSEKEERVRRN